MTIRRSSTLALVLTCAVAPTHGAAMQQTLSSDLKMQIVWPGGSPVETKPGPPPADFPREVLPRGTVPVASGVNGKYTVVVGTLPSRPPAWRAELLSLVSSLGWISQMPSQSGFVMGPADSASMCKGADFVDVGLSTTSTGVNVRAVLSRDPRRECASRGGGSTMSFADVTFPVLEPPAGAKMSGGGGGSNSSEWTSHTQLTSELSMAALADHYRRQIIDAGWNEDGQPAFLEHALVIRFKAPSRIGPALPAMLIINEFDDPHQFDAFLRLTRPPERSPNVEAR